MPFFNQEIEEVKFILPAHNLEMYTSRVGKNLTILRQLYSNGDTELAQHGMTNNAWKDKARFSMKTM